MLSILNLSKLPTEKMSFSNQMFWAGPINIKTQIKFFFFLVIQTNNSQDFWQRWIYLRMRILSRAPKLVSLCPKGFKNLCRPIQGWLKQVRVTAVLFDNCKTYKNKTKIKRNHQGFFWVETRGVTAFLISTHRFSDMAASSEFSWKPNFVWRFRTTHYFNTFFILLAICR